MQAQGAEIQTPIPTQGQPDAAYSSLDLNCVKPRYPLGGSSEGSLFPCP